MPSFMVKIVPQRCCSNANFTFKS